MAVDQFGNELTEEELYELMLQQQQMGLRPHPARVKGFATPPSINYSQVMEDWSDPNILSAPAFDAPRPATTAAVTPVDPTLAGMGDLAMTRFERSKLQLPIGPFTPLPDFTVPDFTPVGPTRDVPGRIRPTIPTANDPTGGLSATDSTGGFMQNVLNAIIPTAEAAGSDWRIGRPSLRDRYVDTAEVEKPLGPWRFDDIYTAEPIDMWATMDARLDDQRPLDVQTQVDTFAGMPGMLPAPVDTSVPTYDPAVRALPGGIPSGRTFGVAAPVSGSPSMANVDYSAALRAVTPSLTYGGQPEGGVPADSTDPQTYFGVPIPPPGKERQEEIKRLREKYLGPDWLRDLPTPEKIIIGEPPKYLVTENLPNFSIIDQAMADAEADKYMAAAADTQDIMMAGGTLGGGMPFAGAVTGAEALINEAPFVSANPLSVLAKTGMMSNLANFDARPAVQEVFDTIMPTTQAAPVAAPVAAPAPTGPSAAEIERQRQAAINARLAQEATARQQQQQAAAVQQAIEFERMSKRLANLRGRDRGVDPSEVAALEAALGGYRGDPAGRQAGGGRGGFDPQGGTTGSSGMGAWT